MRLGDDRQLGEDEPDAIARSHAGELVDAAGRETLSAARPPAIQLSVAGPRYELGARLGTGGMAEVFAGTMIGAEGFARRVAIKRALSGLSQIPAFARMFTAEARIASQLAHPNIVSVLDFHRDPEERLLLVMEYVDGKDLASLLDAGPIAPSLVIFIVVELLRGLGYVHELTDPDRGTRGVVHRDVSPQNLLLSYEGAVKVSDFGLAKPIAGGQGVWSETVRGKPSYMSPEQISGDLLDGRTDLFAVGVMLWEMLAHRPLFTGTTKEILGQVMHNEIARPSRVRGGVPSDLEAIAMTLLARDRRDRYPTAQAALDAMLRCDDVPRDGRGELVNALAARFPRGAGQRSQRCAVGASVPGTHVERITVAAPPSMTVTMIRAFRTLVRPRRARSAALRWGAVLAAVAVALLIAHRPVARSGAPSRAASPAHPGAWPPDEASCSEPSLSLSCACGGIDVDHESARNRQLGCEGEAALPGAPCGPSRAVSRRCVVHCPRSDRGDDVHE